MGQVKILSQCIHSITASDIDGNIQDIDAANSEEKML